MATGKNETSRHAAHRQQTPLWIARQLLGWRLIRGDPSNDAGPAPLAIRDLMVATQMVALSLGLARWAPSPDGEEIEGIWIAMFIMASANQHDCADACQRAAAANATIPAGHVFRQHSRHRTEKVERLAFPRSMYHSE